MHFGHSRQQRRKIPSRRRWIAVAVYVLAQQLNFGVARARELPRLRHHALRRGTALRTARKRHHAICARFVAAFDDGDVRAVGIIAARERRVESFVRFQTQARHPAISGLDPHQHFTQLVIAGRSAHQADVRRPVENLFALLLRHATQNAEELPLPRAFELLQPVKNLLLRLVANAASVVKHQLGFFRRRYLRIALGQ